MLERDVHFAISSAVELMPAAVRRDSGNCSKTLPSVSVVRRPCPSIRKNV